MMKFVLYIYIYTYIYHEFHHFPLLVEGLFVYLFIRVYGISTFVGFFYCQIHFIQINSSISNNSI